MPDLAIWQHLTNTCPGCFVYVWLPADQLVQEWLSPKRHGQGVCKGQVKWQQQWRLAAVAAGSIGAAPAAGAVFAASHSVLWRRQQY